MASKRLPNKRTGYTIQATVVRPASKSLAFSCPNLKRLHDSSICLLTDFGISQDTTVNSGFTLIDGDKRYLAPELKSFYVDYSSDRLKKADIYAAGLIFMQLVLGSLWVNLGLLTLDTKCEISEFDNHSILLDRLKTSQISENIKSIVGACLIQDHSKRPDARTLLSAVKSSVSKHDHNIGMNHLSLCRIQTRTLSSPSPILRLYAQKHLKRVTHDLSTNQLK